MSLSCSAVRLMLWESAVTAVEFFRIAATTSELIVLSAIVAAIERAWLLPPARANEITPPIVYAVMVVSDLAESDIAPAENTFAASAYA